MSNPDKQKRQEPTCKKCEGSGDWHTFVGLENCPDCGGTGKAKLVTERISVKHSAPQTEAVEDMARKCVGDLSRKEKSEPLLPIIRYYINSALAAQAERISELESENQNHAEHRLIYEARIKGLEQQLDEAKKQIEMDTDTINRIREAGERAEMRLKELE